MTAKVPKKKANMRDVAQHAGVSVATVSRFLSGKSRISNQTQAKVAESIEALKFVPSAAARAINSGRSYLVGALVPTLDHAIFSRFLSSLEEELVLSGLLLTVGTTDGDPQKELIRARNLLDLGVEGLIVTGAQRADGFAKLAELYDVPVISTSIYDPVHHTPTVGYDNRAAARLAVEHLRDLGHRKVASISGPTTNNDRTSARLEAVQAAKFEKHVHLETAIDLEAASRAIQTILVKHPDVTGIVCLSDVIAQGVMHGCGSMKLNVPSDVSVVSIDDLPFASFLLPALTTVHLPVGQMGRVVAQDIGNWINSGIRPSHKELESQLIIRDSATRI